EVSRFAFEQAARLFQLALDAGELAWPSDLRHRAELLLDLADALRRFAVDAAPGKAACQETAAIARSIGDPELLARAAIAHSEQLSFGLLEFPLGERDS